MCSKLYKRRQYKDGTYTGNSTGNNRPIKVEVVVKDGAMENIQVVEHTETKGLCDTATDNLIKVMLKNNTTNVDAVSGATKSSNGLKKCS